MPLPAAGFAKLGGVVEDEQAEVFEILEDFGVGEFYLDGLDLLRGELRVLAQSGKRVFFWGKDEALDAEVGRLGAAGATVVVGVALDFLDVFNAVLLLALNMILFLYKFKPYPPLAVLTLNPLFVVYLILVHGVEDLA